MKRVKIFTGVILGLGIVIAVLLSNKAKSVASARSDKLTSVPVTIYTASKQVLEQPIVLVGTILAHNDVAIVAETQGRVTAVHVETGDAVQAGRVLIEVDNELKKAAYDVALATFEKTDRDLKRNEELYKDRTITESQIEASRLAYRTAETQMIVARRQLNDTRITSPIGGVITERRVNVGNMVMPGMAVANVVDVSRLKVKVQLSEKDAFRVKVGDAATITTEVYPGVEFEGQIGSISAKADDAHTYPLEIVLKNSARHPLRSGMFGRVQFKTTASSETIVIPREAIIGSVRDPYVYVVTNGSAQLKRITIAGEADSKVGVSEGLLEGDQVVWSGHGNLRDGAVVTVLK